MSEQEKAAKFPTHSSNSRYKPHVDNRRQRRNLIEFRLDTKCNSNRQSPDLTFSQLVPEQQ